MKVLWFTNTPSLYSNKDLSGGSKLGGWIPSLERIFHRNAVELRIAFHSDVNKLTYDVFDNNNYYLIPNFSTTGKLLKLARRWCNLIEDEKYITPMYRDVVEDFKPDIVQIWGSELPYGLAIPHLNIPSILHIQGNLTVNYAKYYCSISRKQLRRAANIRQFLKRDDFFFDDKMFIKMARRERMIYSYCKNFFGRTDWDKQLVNIMSPNADYYYCGEILRNPFYDNKWENHSVSEPFRAVSIIRDSIDKGLDLIFDVSWMLSKIGFNIQWDVIGIDENGFLNQVVKRIKKYDTEKLNVNLLGKKDADEIIEIFGKAHLMINPSHIENSNNSISEAQLFGMPVLSTAVGGIPSLIHHNETGFLVQSGDSWAMAGAILEIKKNYDYAGKVAENARRTALERHDKDKIFGVVIDTYKKLIANYG